MFKRLAIHPLLHALLTACLILAGCRKENPHPAKTTAAPTVTFLGKQEISRNELNSRMAAVDGIDPNSIWSLIVSNVVNIYKVNYPTTDPAGAPIDASGLMIVPRYSGPVSLISFQNGTILDTALAPSLFSPNSLLHYWIPLVASMGNAVIVPDYLGYGITSNMEHPYQHAASLETSVKDMILAAKIILREQNIPWNNKLFLAGYSEGGYATMAAHRLLEEQYGDSLKVTAVSCGAGAYDITGTARYFLERNEDRDSFYVRTHAWVLLTYDRLYHLNRPLKNYFNPPYDTLLAHTPVTKARLPLNPSQLINPAFKAGILNGTDKEMLDVLANNDVYNWKPKAPVLLIHAALDRFVPILNSERAYASFRDKGAQVEYRVIPFKAHPDAIPDFALHTLLYFGRF